MFQSPSMHRPSRSAAPSRVLLLIAVYSALTLGTAACSSSSSGAGSSSGTSASETSSAAQDASSVQHLDPQSFATRISQAGVVLLDVRTPSEYAEGHIAHARNIDVQGADFTTKIAALDKSASYAIYCHSGKRSSLAAAEMADAGFTSVVDLSGGITAWTQAGKQVTTS
jgi:phage shock protein E